MRIIAGQRRGKRLWGPADRTIRPTSDRLRESIFNILGGRVDGAGVLDLFAGTGAMGIEALSRGARSACFVDCAPQALRLIRRNLAACGFSEIGHVVPHDALSARLPAVCPPPYDLIFIDPPYGRGLIRPMLERLVGEGIAGPSARIVVEHAPEEPPPEAVGPWRCHDRRRWGKTLVSFLGRML